MAVKVAVLAGGHGIVTVLVVAVIVPMGVLVFERLVLMLVAM